jgi:mRNA-degrading endonuclease toxin of MazEF toxin-antitoxin module
MNVSRGDIVLTRVPHAAGGRGKKRPAVVIQSNQYNQSERHLIVAEITSNLSRATEPVNLLIEIATQDGRATGLTSDSVVTCLQLATISADRIDRVIGKLSPSLLQ